MPTEWRHTEHTDGRASAQYEREHLLLSAWDWRRSDRPVRWYVSGRTIPRTLAEGDATTMDEGKAAAVAAAERWEAEFVARISRHNESALLASLKELREDSRE